MNDEKFYTKVLGISVCFIYFIIAVCVVFIIGISRVDALSTNLTFSESNTKQFCNGSNCISAKVDYPFFNWTNYYRFTPTSPWTFKVGNLHTFNLYGVSEYNVSDYDYILMTVTSSNNISVSSAMFSDFGVYGYALNTSFSSFTEGQDGFMYNNTYTTILKFDVSSTDKIGSQLIFYFTGLDDNVNPDILINYKMYFGKNGDDLNTAINNQTTQITDTIKQQTEAQKETNDKLDKVNDSLTDSNVDDSMDSAGGFFNSFEDKDHGGLSGIITAPLVAINKMLSKECTAMTGTYEGTEFSLPSGCDFWSRIKGVQDFLNVVEGGMLCYLIIRQMFFLVQSLKNPEEDRVEVMDL